MNKKNFTLAIILVCLIAVAYFYKGPLKEWREKGSNSDNFLSGVEIDEIDSMEITKNGNTTKLERTGDFYADSDIVKWKIAGTKDFFVEVSLAGEIINSLKEANDTTIEEISNNKDKKSDFETNEELGVKLTLFKENEKALEFLIGKLGYDFNSSYISELNSDSTYLIPINLSLFNRSDWYDKTIISMNMEMITKLRFQYLDRQFTMEKKVPASEEEGVIWQGIEPYTFNVNTDKINEILNIFSNLTAISIPEQNFEGTGLEKNSIIIQATGEGIDSTLMIGDKDEENNYYAIKIGSDNIYLITEDQENTFDIDIKDLQ